MAKWYLANAGGSPIGPVRTDALLRRIRGGTLAPETLIWTEGMDDWIPVERMPELSAELMRDDPEDDDAQSFQVHTSAFDSGEDATVARPPPRPPASLPVIPAKVLEDISPESQRTVVSPEHWAPRAPATVPDRDAMPPSSGGRDSWRTVVVPQAEDRGYVPPPPSTGFPIDTSAFEPARGVAPMPPIRDKPDSVTRIRAEGEYIAPRVVPGPYPAARDDAAPSPRDAPPRTVRLPGVPPARGPMESESTVIAPLPDPAARRRALAAGPAGGSPGGTLMLPQSPFAERRPPSPPPVNPARPTSGGTAIFPRGFGIPPPAQPVPYSPPPQPFPARPLTQPPPPQALAPPPPPAGVPAFSPPQAGVPPSAYGPVVTPPVEPERPAVAPRPAAPAPAAASASSKGMRTRLIVAAVFAVGLLVGIIGARKVVAMREEGSGGDLTTTGGKGPRLLVPCLSALLPELRTQKAAQDVACGDLTLALKNESAVLTLTVKGIPADGVATRTPELVARILPNLPDPNVARAIPLRPLGRLDLRGQGDSAHKTQAAIKAYHDAEQLVEAYEAMGGHRFARWLQKEGRLEAENTVTADGRVIVVRFYPGQGAPGSLADVDQGLDGPDAPWKPGSWNPPVDDPSLAALRKKMMDQGWWYDDASAFLAAAVAAGLDKSSDTTEGLAVVAEWLRSSDQWDVKTRVTIWNVCLTRSVGASRGFTRQRFDELAGVWKDATVFSNPPEFHTPDEESAVYARIFAAAIGSPAHAYCASAVGQRLLEETGDAPESRVIRHAPDGPRGIAQRLLSSAKFVASMRAEMAKSRGALLKPGPPDM